MRSDLDKYAYDRNIGILFRGSEDNTLFFDVMLPHNGITSRVRSNLEKRMLADSPGCALDIVYFQRGSEVYRSSIS